MHGQHLHDKELSGPKYRGWEPLVWTMTSARVACITPERCSPTRSSPRTAAKSRSGPLGPRALARGSEVTVPPDTMRWALRLGPTRALSTLPAVPRVRTDIMSPSCQYLSVPSFLLGPSEYPVLSRYLDKMLFTHPVTSRPAQPLRTPTPTHPPLCPGTLDSNTSPPNQATHSSFTQRVQRGLSTEPMN